MSLGSNLHLPSQSYMGNKSYIGNTWCSMGSQTGSHWGQIPDSPTDLGMGITSDPFGNFSVRDISIFENVSLQSVELHPYLTGVIAAKLRKHGWSRFTPSQCETLLQSNAMSHWLGTNLEPAMWKWYLTGKLKFLCFSFPFFFFSCIIQITILTAVSALL